MERRVQHLDDGAAGERGAAGQHLEEQSAYGKKIASRIDRLAVHLLGGHVARGAHQHAGACQVDIGACG